MADQQLCGKWMPRAQTTCVRTPQHGGPCATPKAMEAQRQRSAARDRPHDPVARSRWNLAYKLSRYGLTPQGFARMLTAQQNACAMCFTPFEEGQPVCIDHDHACCPDEKASCGKCVRGLLCVSCNTALGIIERKYEMARVYLNGVRVGQVA